MAPGTVVIFAQDDASERPIGEGALIHPNFVVMFPPLSAQFSQEDWSSLRLELAFPDNDERWEVNAVHVADDGSVGMDFMKAGPTEPHRLLASGDPAGSIQALQHLISTGDSDPSVVGDPTHSNDELSVCDIWRNAWFCMVPGGSVPDPVVD